MLATRELIAGYGDTPVLHEVTMHVAPGEFVGLIGPNGCGKTTLLRVLSGVLPVMSGQVLVGGADLRRLGRRELARIMACLMQDLSLEVPFSVREVAMMGRSPHLTRLGRQTRRDRDIVARALALADVEHLADRPVTEISGGERQRAFIAMCLAQEPQLLLLDEPTNHLDVGHQLSLLDLIRRLNHDTDMTVVAVFHDLNLSAEYCDRLLMLDRGRVEAFGGPGDVLTIGRLRRVYRTNVMIEPNPHSGKPHVVIAAGMNHSESAVGK